MNIEKSVIGGRKPSRKVEKRESEIMLEAPEYLKEYDEEVGTVILEMKGTEEIDAEDLEERLEGEDGEKAAERVEESFREGDEAMAEALIADSLTKEDLIEIKEALALIVDKAEITKNDTYATWIRKLIESRYGAKAKTVLRAFKGLGPGIFIGLGEALYSGYQAARAESSEARQEKLKESWDSAVDATGFLLLPEISYRAGRYVFGDKKEKAFQIEEMKKALKNSSALWRWTLGDQEEKAEAIDQARVSALIMADVATLGSLATYGLTKEAVVLSRDAYAISQMYTSRIEALEKRLDSGESITIWDVSSEFIQAGMEASGKGPKEVLELMSATIEDADYIKQLPSRQQKALRLVAQVLQNEEGQEKVLERIQNFDRLLAERKK